MPHSRIRYRLTLWLFRVCLPIMLGACASAPRATPLPTSGKVVIDTTQQRITYVGEDFQQRSFDPDLSVSRWRKGS